MTMRETITSIRWWGHQSFVADDINNIQFYQGPLEFIKMDSWYLVYLVCSGLIFPNITFLQHYAPYFRRVQALEVDGTFLIVP